MQKPWMPVVAGLLDIISGAMGLGFGLFLALNLHFPRFAQAAGKFGAAAGGATGGNVPSMFFPGANLVFGIAAMLLGVLAVLGGVYALKVKTWGLALAGSIAAVITGRVLGVVALIFVVLGRSDFQK